ncbi:PAS domain S-box protein [Candidatus Cloacimonadota bacterium]
MDKKRILIVEDETIVAEDIRTTIQKHDYDVTDVVSSGEEALNSIKTKIPDLALMDIMLEKEMTGVEVAKHMEKLDIPVVFLTAYADKKRIAQAKITKPFGYLLKPFRERELLATIEMALYKHSIDKKLHESNTNFKRIFENIQDVYFETNLEGTILQISPSVEDMTSYSVDELLGTSVLELYYNVADRDSTLSKLTKDSTLKDYPISILDKDGTRLPCICSAKLIVDVKTQEAKIIGSIRSISDNVDIKSALKKYEERYRKLFESTIDAVMLTDDKGFFDCNDAALKMFGFSEKKHLSGLMREELSPKLQADKVSSKELAEKHQLEAYNSGSSKFEWIHKRQNGEEFPAEVWLTAFKLKGKQVIQTTIRDMTQSKKDREELQRSHDLLEKKVNERTAELEQINEYLQNEILERKQAEERSKSGEAFYNTLFEHNPVETIVVNKKGEIIQFNLAVKNNRSHPPKIGDIMYKDYAAHHDGDMFGNLIDCMKTGKTRIYPEMKYKEKTWSITIAPNKHGAIISSINISAEKHAEEQLMRLNQVFENLGTDSHANIEYIVQQTGIILNASCSLYFRLDENTEKTNVFASYNTPGNFDNLNTTSGLICLKETIGKNKITQYSNLDKTKYKSIDKFIEKYGLKSYLGFPTTLNSRTIGSLCIFDVEERKFSKNEISIISTLAKAISIEEERMQVANSLKKISTYQKLLLTTTKDINSTLDFREVAERITVEAMELLDSYGSAVYLLNDDGKTLDPIVVIDPDFKDEIMNATLDIDTSFTGKSIINKRAMMFNDAGETSNGFQIPGTTEEKNERILVAPLITDDEVLGAICLNRIGPHFEQEDVEILETLANYATTALVNASAFEQMQHEMHERLLAEQRRDESEKKYSSLISNVPVGIFRSNARDKIISANPAMVKMFGYNDLKELLKTTIHELYSTSEKGPELLKLLNENDEIDDFEIVLTRKDGSTFWGFISTKSVYDTNGKIIFRDGIINDVSKRKKAELNLQTTQFRLATLFENVPNILLYESGEDREFMSDNVIDLLGYPAEDFIKDKDKFFSLLHEDDVDYIKKKYKEWEAEDKKEVLTLWFRIRTKVGRYIWIEDRRIETVGPDNKRYETGVKIDITNLKNAEEQLKISYQKLQRLLEETVDGLVSAVEMRDPYTAGHQRRVATLTVAIGKKLGLSQNEIEGLHLASLVHDIGKINIPAEILSKPGKLSENEFNLIKLHPQTGYDILKSIEFPWPIAEIVLQHQERYDGSSYPQGLKGEEINFYARILSVADVMEAMSSHRPYRASLGIQSAIEEITTYRGKLYDPVVVDAALDLFQNDGFDFADYEEAGISVT